MEIVLEKNNLGLCLFFEHQYISKLCQSRVRSFVQNKVVSITLCKSVLLKWVRISCSPNFFLLHCYWPSEALMYRNCMCVNISIWWILRWCEVRTWCCGLFCQYIGSISFPQWEFSAWPNHQSKKFPIRFIYNKKPFGLFDTNVV